MTLPQDNQTPVIMVGPGTGVAAFRSFIHTLSTSDSKPQMVLIFGCRSETSDYYYKDEWASVDDLKVMAAFSRDNADGSKQYVQHVIKLEENGKYLAQLITQQNAYIYVSGRAKLMPKSVEKAFKEILDKWGKGIENQGQEYINQMKKQRRYQQEVW